MSDVRSRIILVDDNLSSLDQGKSKLKTFYAVYTAVSAAKMFEILENITPDLILLDIEMPEINGYETIKALKADPRYADIPVIFLTTRSDESSEQEGFDLGAVDYVTKPFSTPLLLKRISNQLLIVKKTKDLQASQKKIQDYANNLEAMVREKTEEVINLQNAVLSTVADLVEFRDKNTGGHIARTQLYLKTLVDALIENGKFKDELSGWNLGELLLSAQLHDVGKIAISDIILNKPERLTPDEFKVIKTHVDAGVEAIDRIIKKTKKHAFLDHALIITGTHHEKWDGSGYPMGLKGKNIPLQGRLMAIVDVYDALVAERPYKKAMPHEEACIIIVKGAGSHFDPVLIEVFRGVADQFDRIQRDNHSIGGI